MLSIAYDNILDHVIEGSLLLNYLPIMTLTVYPVIIGFTVVVGFL